MFKSHCVFSVCLCHFNILKRTLNEGHNKNNSVPSSYKGISRSQKSTLPFPCQCRNTCFLSKETVQKSPFKQQIDIQLRSYFQVINSRHFSQKYHQIIECLFAYFKELLILFKYRSNSPFKVRKRPKIRNPYNQVPHLTQDTNGKVTNESQALSQQVTTRHQQTDMHESITKQDRN